MSGQRDPWAIVIDDLRAENERLRDVKAIVRRNQDLDQENERLREALIGAREIIVREFGERDPLKPWDFIDEALGERA